MTDTSKPAGTRMRLVSSVDRKRRRRCDLDREAYVCRLCSRELGYPFCHLVQAILAAAEAGREILDGELWWICPRCFRPRYFIRRTNRDRGMGSLRRPGSGS